MTLDHLRLFFPGVFPAFFHSLGRIAMPVFLFCLAQGMDHTRSPRRYLARLYGAGAAMGAGSGLLCLAFGGELEQNIFPTLFLTAALICLASLAQKGDARARKWGAVFLISQLAAGLFSLFPLPGWLAAVRNGLLPSLWTAEGGAVFVLIGIGIWLCRSSRKLLGLFLTAVSALFFVSSSSGQWQMVLCLPLLFRYNGLRGKGWKSFFYLYYPLHLWGLFFLSRLLA